MNFYCINTASAKDRWTTVSKKFEAEGIQVTRFNAWDNTIAKLTATYPYEKDAPGSGYIMAEKYVGTYLSHWMLWNYLAMLPDESFFIFEDDVIFEPNWKICFDEISLLPSDWDLFYVGNCCLKGWADNIQFSPTILRTKKAQCLHAYIVRAKAIPFMLEKTQKVWAAIDLALLWECQEHLNVFARVPRLVIQEDTVIPP